MAFFTFWNVECEMAGVHMCYFATTIVGRAALEFLDVRCLMLKTKIGGNSFVFLLLGYGILILALMSYFNFLNTFFICSPNPIV